MSGAEDINGDSLSDVIIGAPYYGANGAAFVYYGASTGIGSTPDLILNGNLPGERFGWSVSSAGDVNGDGYGDVIIGAIGCSHPEQNEGCAYVYLGSSAGLNTTPAWSVESNQAYAGFGYVVGSAGDVNHDGVGDVFVGAPNYTNGQASEGKVFVYHGSQANGLSAVPNWEKEGDQDNAHFGLSVSAAGDVNGDQFDDLIMGAPNASDSQPGEGKVFLFVGSASGLSATANWTVSGGQGDAHLGEAVSSAGDINGDGFSDVMVSAPDHDNGETDEGIVFVYLGSVDGVNTQPIWMGEGDQAGINYGVALASAGDVDQDGFADILIGANRFTNGQENEGMGFLFYGTSNGIDSTRAWNIEGEQAYGNLGYALASAGDVNGDSYADILFSAPQMDYGETDEGKTFLYYGRP